MQQSDRTAVEQEAYELGVEHARNVASWIIDGNTSSEHVARMVKMLDEGDPAVYDYLPREPNLSGEFADDMSPAALYVLVELDWETDAELLDDVCDAYDQGVAETFTAECERILRAAMGA